MESGVGELTTVCADGLPPALEQPTRRAPRIEPIITTTRGCRYTIWLTDPATTTTSLPLELSMWMPAQLLKPLSIPWRMFQMPHPEAARALTGGLAAGSTGSALSTPCVP